MNNATDMTRLMKGIDTLTHLSGQLREAMLARDTDRINELVESQAELHLNPPLPFVDRALMDAPEVKQATGRLVRMQESNRLLAATFLGIYRDTLQAVSPKRTAMPGGYGRNGSLAHAGHGSLIVQHTG